MIPVNILKYHSMFDGVLGIEVGVGGPAGPLSLSPVDLVSIVEYVAERQPIQRVELELLDGWAESESELETLVASLQSVAIPMTVTMQGTVFPKLAQNLPRIVLITAEPWLQYSCAHLVYTMTDPEAKPHIREGVAGSYWVTSKSTTDTFKFIRKQAVGSKLPLWRLWPKMSIDAVSLDLSSLDFPNILRSEREKEQ